MYLDLVPTVATKSSRALSKFHSSLATLFDNGFKFEEDEQRSIIPKADIYELETEFTVEVELPGVKRENIDIQVANKKLKISGEMENTRNSKKTLLHNYERSIGAFERVFAFNCDIDPSTITAELKEGILYVHIPKPERAVPKKIPIA